MKRNTSNIYQWYKNNISIPGANDTAYIFSNFIAENDTGTYYCIISNSVATELEIESEPVHEYTKPNFTVTFTVTNGVNPIIGAMVSLTGYENQTTDVDGEAIFPNIVAENNIIYTVTALGYYDVTDSINVTDSTVTENVIMTVTSSNILQNFSNIKIFPNPSNGFVTFSSDFRLNGRIKLVNIMGQVVKSFNITSGNQQIDLRHLTKGLYYIKIGDEKYFRIEKLIIE